jgi:hypothetical protein
METVAMRIKQFLMKPRSIIHMHKGTKYSFIHSLKGKTNGTAKRIPVFAAALDLASSALDWRWSVAAHLFYH